jgi:hypothetical protein
MSSPEARRLLTADIRLRTKAVAAPLSLPDRPVQSAQTSRRRPRCHARVNTLRKSFGRFEGTQQPFD